MTAIATTVLRLLRMTAGFIVWASALVFLYGGRTLACRHIEPEGEAGLLNPVTGVLILLVLVHLAVLGVLALRRYRDSPPQSGDAAAWRFCHRLEALILWVSLAAVLWISAPVLMDGTAVRRLIALAAAASASDVARAHAVEEHAGDWVLWLLIAVLLGYAIGWLRSGHKPERWRVLSFVGGWLLLANALVGPVEAWQRVSLAGHMVQHMTLIAVAPPLLLLARPMLQYMRAPPSGLRRRLGPPLGGLYGVAGGTPIAAFVVHFLVIWLWHLPLPYQLALVEKLIHDFEHLMFFGSALWFWCSLIAPTRLGRPGFGLAAILAVLTLMHTGMLGALMTFAPQLLYPTHPAGFAGFDQLSDQQLAGLLMWIPGGVIYSVAALVLFSQWLQHSTRRNETPQR